MMIKEYNHSYRMILTLYRIYAYRLCPTSVELGIQFRKSDFHLVDILYPDVFLLLYLLEFILVIDIIKIIERVPDRGGIYVTELFSKTLDIQISESLKTLLRIMIVEKKDIITLFVLITYLLYTLTDLRRILKRIVNLFDFVLLRLLTA